MSRAITRWQVRRATPSCKCAPPFVSLLYHLSLLLPNPCRAPPASPGTICSTSIVLPYVPLHTCSSSVASYIIALASSTSPLPHSHHVHLRNVLARVPGRLAVASAAHGCHRSLPPRLRMRYLRPLLRQPACGKPAHDRRGPLGRVLRIRRA